MAESPLAGRPEFVPEWDVYRDSDGNPVTITGEQCAAVLHALRVVEAVRKAEGCRPLLPPYPKDQGMNIHAEVTKSRLLGRMLHEGLPPTRTRPPVYLAAPAWDLLYGGDPFGPKYPRVEIDPNVRVGGNGTYAGFEDVHNGDPATMKRWDWVRVFEPESGLEGPARVERVDHERKLLHLQVEWSLLRGPDG